VTAGPVHEPDLVLHVLGLRGCVLPEQVAEATGLPTSAVERRLDEAREAGLVSYRSGRVTGWFLTPAGRTARLDHLDRERAGGSWVPAVTRIYAGFSDLNGTFKQLCTDWQTGHDRPTCIERLRALDRAVGELLTDLAAVLPRTARYGPRLREALARLSAGDESAFLQPLSGSYHDIWMELHEDLLRTLGRSRGDGDG